MCEMISAVIPTLVQIHTIKHKLIFDSGGAAYGG